MSTPRIPPEDCPCGKAQTCYECTHPPSERDKVLKQLHNWFEKYCEVNEEPDLWMAFLHAERALREAGE